MSFETFPEAAVRFSILVIKCLLNEYIEIKFNRGKLEALNKSNKT